MTLTSFIKIARTLATLSLVTLALVQSYVQPSLFDGLWGAAIGITLYALWR